MKTKLNFLLRTAFSVVSSMLFAAGVAPSAPAASFRGLGDLPGGDFASGANAVSADGKVVVGYGISSNGNEAFLWTATNGMAGMGDLPGGIFYSLATGVSADGTVVVGGSSSASGPEAFRWTAATGMVPLGDLPGGSFSSAAYAVSADGRTVVGESSSAFSGTFYEAFRWTAATGMVPLGDLSGGSFRSDAHAVSADGSVVVGTSVSSNGHEAYRWTETTGMVGLGDFPGGYTNSLGFGVSADGSVVVGRGYSGAYDLSTHEAFRWTAQSGLIPLGFAPGDDWSIAYAVSADGNTVVGDNANRAVIWDPHHGMRHLLDVLTNDHGLNLTGWTLTRARAISPDGITIAGFGINPAGKYEAWIAIIKPPSLAIRRETNNVVLFWETNAPGFVLEETPSLSSTSVWSAVSTPISVINGQCVVTNSGSSTSFFRLRKP